MNFVSLVFDLVRIILGMLFVDFKQGQFGSKCITKASWTWGEKCHISNYLQFLTVIGTDTYLEKDTAHWHCSHAILRLYMFRTCILCSTIRLCKCLKENMRFMPNCTTKFWYLLLRNIWPLLPKFYISKERGSLGCG